MEEYRTVQTYSRAPVVTDLLQTTYKTITKNSLSAVSTALLIKPREILAVS